MLSGGELDLGRHWDKGSGQLTREPLIQRRTCRAELMPLRRGLAGHLPLRESVLWVSGLPRMTPLTANE